jgi:hypothetical protein
MFPPRVRCMSPPEEMPFPRETGDRRTRPISGHATAERGELHGALRRSLVTDSNRRSPMVEHLDMQRVLDEHTEMSEMLKHLRRYVVLGTPDAHEVSQLLVRVNTPHALPSDWKPCAS